MFLEFLVVILPSIFGLTMELVNKSIRERWYYRMGIVLFGISLSGLTYLEIYKSHKDAAKEQQTAIEETSNKVSASVSESVSKSVTKSVTDQYAQTINTLQTKIGSLEAQLSAQGKKVDIIQKSKVVSGKEPLAVVVTNPSPNQGGPNPAEIHVARLTATPNPQYGKNAVEFILTTNRVMNGGRVWVTCSKGKINQGTAYIPGANLTMAGGGGVQDDHTYVSGISSPNWSPDFPLVITLYFDSDDLGLCNFRPLQ